MRLYLIPTENHGIIQYATTHNYKAFPGIKQYYSARVSAVLSTEAPLLFILIHNFKKMPQI